MSQPDYKEILISLLATVSLADHTGDVYSDCMWVAKLCGLMEGYDPEAEYFYDPVDGGDRIEAYSYEHFAHYLEKEKGALPLWKLQENLTAVIGPNVYTQDITITPMQAMARAFADANSEQQAEFFEFVDMYSTDYPNNRVFQWNMMAKELSSEAKYCLEEMAQIITDSTEYQLQEENRKLKEQVDLLKKRELEFYDGNY